MIRIIGACLMLVGLVMCLTIVGAVIGGPLIFIGLIFFVAGGRRRTVITNVVQVTNVVPASEPNMRPVQQGVMIDAQRGNGVLSDQTASIPVQSRTVETR